MNTKGHSRVAGYYQSPVKSVADRVAVSVLRYVDRPESEVRNQLLRSLEHTKALIAR